jgi:hypothetical protein
MVYPMSWDLANRNIPGVNRSTFYNTICGACWGLEFRNAPWKMEWKGGVGVY